MMLLIWTIAAGFAGIYCIVRAFGDLKKRRYVVGALALISALIFLLAPVETHKMTVTLPVASNP